MDAAPVSVEQALENKFSLPHFIFLREVRDRTGFEAGAAMDGMAISLYRTNGRAIIGFEVKRSRADWLRELKDPGKAEKIGKYCDFFYLVTSDQSIAKLEEIPGPWGWMTLVKSRLKVVKKPEKLDAAPMDRYMLTSLLYRTMTRFTKDFDTEVNKRIDEEAESRFKMRAGFAHRAEQNLKELQDAVREFEQHSGIYISYRGSEVAKVGDAVRVLLREQGTLNGFMQNLEYIRSSAHRLVVEADSQIKAVRERIQGDGDV